MNSGCWRQRENGRLPRSEERCQLTQGTVGDTPIFGQDTDDDRDHPGITAVEACLHKPLAHLSIEGYVKTTSRLIFVLQEITEIREYANNFKVIIFIRIISLL